MTVCLLASYPKSGNTWMRALLTVCLTPAEPLSLEALAGPNAMIDPDTLRAELGTDPFDLTLDQLDEARAALLRLRNAGASVRAPEFVKTHATNRLLPSGRRFADAATGIAIYLSRHPFDVAVSYAHFLGLPAEEISTAMLEESAVIDRAGRRAPGVLAETLSSWSTHVDSWTREPPLPTVVVRYEDLLAEPAQQLRRVLDVVELSCDERTLDRAVAECSFAALRRLEATEGFSMKPASAERFFRAGTSGQGAGLPETTRDLLRERLREPMARLGYR